MREHKTIKVDSKKLERLLLKKGYNKSNAGLAIGRSSSFFSKMYAVGETTYTTAKAIEAVFGIKIEDFELKEEPTPPPVYVIKPEVEKALLELMKRAVREVLAE